MDEKNIDSKWKSKKYKENRRDDRLTREPDNF